MSLGTQQSGGSLKPEYLCAWTMKGKYFANSIRLEAKQKVGMSYALISVLHRMELVKKGMLWRVGDGRNLKICFDPWFAKATL